MTTPKEVWQHDAIALTEVQQTKVQHIQASQQRRKEQGEPKQRNCRYEIDMEGEWRTVQRGATTTTTTRR